jgi:hypothetical protein
MSLAAGQWSDGERGARAGHSTVGLVILDGGSFIEPPGSTLVHMGAIDSSVHPLTLELESTGRRLVIGGGRLSPPPALSS